MAAQHCLLAPGASYGARQEYSLFVDSSSSRGQQRKSPRAHVPDADPLEAGLSCPCLTGLRRTSES